MSELIDLLNHPRVTHPSAVHLYECNFWRTGKRHEPCSCGAKELDEKIRVALIAAGVDLSGTPQP